MKIPKKLLIYSKDEMPEKPPLNFFSVEKENQLIYYFGADHSVDPEHPQFEQIKKKWEEFLVKSKGSSRQVLIENKNKIIEYKDEDSAIKRGEGSFTAYLAMKSNVSFSCPEPSREIELEELLKKFSKEEIYLYYFTRAINSWRRLKQKYSFEEFAGKILKRDKEVFGWSDFDFSLDNIFKIHKDIFNGDFDKTNENFISSITRPDKSSTITNRVAQTTSNTRNAYIVNQIEKYLKEGKSIFIVYGQGHSIVQEPAIRELLK